MDDRMGENQALIDALGRLQGAKIEEIIAGAGQQEIHALALLKPVGMELRSLKPIIDEFRARPERIRGTAKIGDLESFLAHIARFGSERSAIFADPAEAGPYLLAVYDYSEPDEPAFHEHRARYACPLSDEWKAWAARDGQNLSQADLAAFIEDRIGDVIVPDTAGEDSQLGDFAKLMGATFATPQRLVELSRGLSLKAEVAVKQAVNLSSGEAQVSFQETHASGELSTQLLVPNYFIIAIPVFLAGPAYRIPVRLRYRLSQGRITWSYTLHRADKVFDHAFNEVVSAARERSGRAVFVGTPES